VIPVASIREGLEIFARELETVIREPRSWKAKVATACRGTFLALLRERASLEA
jgi:hypothetical protein